MLCRTLSGLDIPILTITSRVNSLSANLISTNEVPNESDNKSLNSHKKVVVITGRVHPGESNSSFMMQGFIKFLLGSDPKAQELRKRIVFKIIPMINPDGVIVGNYRTSMSGNDLNRQYLKPHY